jgi:DNA-binding response OmpR family regulator
MAGILLVADAAWVRNKALAALGGPAHEIIDVDDPRAALDVAAERRPDIAIVDMQVGSMGGMAVTRSLKDGALTGDTDAMPIVLLLDRSADEFLAKRAGADAWLVKPFTAQDLAGAVNSLLGVPQP